MGERIRAAIERLVEKARELLIPPPPLVPVPARPQK
jgi:hypothetical protein